MAQSSRRGRRARRETREHGASAAGTGSAVVPTGQGKAAPIGAAFPTCPLCQRPIPPHARQSLHHLVPKLRGGAKGPTVLVHQICHNEIHAALTETELAREFNTPEALRAHPRLARFAAWIGDKDPAFHSRTVGNHRKRRR